MLGSARPPVLVVEDNEAIRENVGECLADEGYTCWLEDTADHALLRLERELREPAAVLLDLRMPGMPARQFVSRLKERADWSRARVILMTAAAREEIPPGLPFDAVLPKPFGVPELLRIVEGAVASAPP